MNVRTGLPAVTIFHISVVFLTAFFGGAACSTAPKRPVEIVEQRTMAESQMELANRAADQGDYGTALLLLDDSWRIAVGADDPSLRIRTDLSRGNVLFSQGRGEEAARAWAAALAEAELSGLEELAAISRIHIARGALLAAGEGAGRAGTIREEVRRELGRVKSDPFYIAFGWVAAALADKEAGRYDEAEASVKKALAFHEKQRFLEQAAYDWYLIAWIRSTAGRYAAAREALESALALDRRAENSWGLATDWRALGDVQKKAGNTVEAEAAYRRAAEIFEVLGMDDAAKEAAGRMTKLSP
jgi:tetratricopeptide (TPR) repeat protein